MRLPSVTRFLFTVNVSGQGRSVSSRIFPSKPQLPVTELFPVSPNTGDSTLPWGTDFRVRKTQNVGLTARIRPSPPNRL